MDTAPTAGAPATPITAGADGTGAADTVVVRPTGQIH
ncbi:hypothetical protein FHR36_006877 [Kitasatospora paracochleata]|uniref:Uncharacterized protein n=1 Tax=Kitasatospora paracochleata TaxID=58354 RepID=A0ABT1J9E1_9ACTN|nr:hypothetical protein [Kitasatospora paracochleata]